MNLDTLTLKAYQKIYELDEKFIGTENYMGIAYFWHYAFRHYLRDAADYQRVKVHKAFLDHNLNVSDDTVLHLQIIKNIIKQTF
jgi:hypothetical protein